MNNVPFTVFLFETGEILRSGWCPSGWESAQAADATQGVLGFESDDLLHYVVAGDRTDRPTLSISKTEIVADDTDEAVISGLPSPVNVMIDGVSQVVEGGVLTLTSATPATYSVEINHWPFLPFRVEVKAI